jgi:hypothetical protein
MQDCGYMPAACYVTKRYSYAVEKCIHGYMLLETQDRALRVMFGCKRGEVTGEWRKLHNEGLHDMSCSTIIILVTN